MRAGSYDPSNQQATTQNDVLDGAPSPFNGRVLVCVLLGAALVAYVTALAVAPSPAVDLFWQLRTGKNIALTHSVPQFDDYSWSRPHHPWILHEWAMCLLLWECFHHDGFGGVWMMQAILLATIFASLFAVLLRETERAPMTCVCLAVWAAKLASPLIAPRAHLITWLCTVLLMGIVLDVRRNPRRIDRLWLLPFICAIWANFHGGVIIGVGLLAIFGICDFVQATASSRQSAVGSDGAPSEETRQMMMVARREVAVAICCAAALIANPYGWRLYQIFGMTVGDRTMPSFVTEWSALDFHSLLGITFEAFAAVIIAGLALSRKRRDLADIIVVAALIHASLTASRNVPIFALAGLPVAARHIQSMIERLLSEPKARAAEAHMSRERESSLFGSTPPIGAVLVICLAIVLQSAGIAAGQMKLVRQSGTSILSRVASVSFDLDQFPSAACRFLRVEGFPTSNRMYNDYNLGGYILYTLPEYRIFISTQTDVYFGKVLSDYAALDDAPFHWQHILNRYHPDFVLTSTGEAQSRLFAASPDWALCYADDANLDESQTINALIFVRNTPENAALIARCRRDCPAIAAHPSLLARPSARTVTYGN